jgi:hypothetical protein
VVFVERFSSACMLYGFCATFLSVVACLLCSNRLRRRVVVYFPSVNRKSFAGVFL